MRTRNRQSLLSRRALQSIVLGGLGLVITFMLLGRNALPRAQAAGGSAPPHGMEKIQHVIWIIQENHSFDNYFGTFPNADGIPPSTCLAEMPGSKKCVKPFHMPAGQPLLDLEHSWETAQAAYDHGTMDGFVWVEGSPYTMGYYDADRYSQLLEVRAPLHPLRPLLLLGDDRKFTQPRLHRRGAVG